MPIISDFIQRYPEVEINMVLTNQTVDLVEGGYDLAIRLGKLSDSSMMAKRLTSRTQYVCASPIYLAKFGIPHSLSELKHHNCLTGNYDHWRFIESGKEKSVRIFGSLTCNSGYGLRDAAIKGIGLIKLPDYYIAKDLDSGDLVSILENCYISYMGESLPSKIIFNILSSKLIIPVAGIIGANTAGVGVCYLSENLWHSLLNQEGLQVMKSSPTSSLKIHFLQRIFCLIKRIDIIHIICSK